MAVYKKLSLLYGGGIVSRRQQADQVANTASVLIGLGGTGIDCLRAIKTQVHTSLKPDDPLAIVPSYRHIRFLGVDTDEGSRGNSMRDVEEAINSGYRMALDETEFFSIANHHILHIPKAIANERRDLDWLSYEELSGAIFPRLSGNHGAGAVRQVGRLMMMDRSDEFMSRVRHEILAARQDLMSPTVNVHIFAGLSGGTGSGCFLDVCYMVRSIASEVGGVSVYGYFFLPDVNLSRIPLESTFVREHLPKNGYAAMQELDYCMQLQHNGGAFTQEYKGGRRIKWDTAPVDMCHLIDATNSNRDYISNAYDYVINATAEYVVDFLTAIADWGFGFVDTHFVDTHLAEFKPVVGQIDSMKTFGSEMSYAAIGASCASIPMREINTYLASELFARFAVVGGNAPMKEEVEQLVVRALGEAGGGIDGVYESLLRQIREKAEGGFRPFRHDWRFVRDHGNEKLVRDYAVQMSEQAGNIAANASHMTSPNNECSLLRRIERELEAAIRDVERGPVYAHRMLDAAEWCNLVNVVDGLIAQNDQRWHHEAAQVELRMSEYEDAKADFEARLNAPLEFGCRKRFETYEFHLRQFYLHRLELKVYEEMDGVLRELRAQLVRRDAGYYLRLARVMQNLIDTFAENRNALQSERAALDSTGGFAEPMTGIAELRHALDAEVKRVDVPGMFDALMETLLENEAEWLPEDEGRIARLVNGFFVERAFGGFAGRTITRFLSDKYGTATDAELADHVYRWIRHLTQKASPLFSFDPSVWDESQTSRMAFVSVPSASAPIKAAAERVQRENSLWQVKESDQRDRIVALVESRGFPLSSYSECSEYEDKYFRKVFDVSAAGRHVYEGKPVEGMAFDDWRRLPPLTPQSLIDTSKVNRNLAEYVEDARLLFDEAMKLGLLDEEGHILKPEENSIAKVHEACAAARELLDSFSTEAQTSDTSTLIRQLRAARDIALVPSGSKLRNDGSTYDTSDRLRILKDYFVCSPAFHEGIRVNIQKLKIVSQEADELLFALEEIA